MLKVEENMFDEEIEVLKEEMKLYVVLVDIINEICLIDVIIGFEVGNMCLVCC